MLFVGTQSGSIRVLKYPLSNDPLDYQKHCAHCGPVTKLSISQDDQYLFSCSEDGSVYVFRVYEKEDLNIKRDQSLVFADEVYIKQELC